MIRFALPQKRNSNNQIEKCDEKLDLLVYLFHSREKRSAFSRTYRIKTKDEKSQENVLRDVRPSQRAHPLPGEERRGFVLKPK